MIVAVMNVTAIDIDCDDGDDDDNGSFDSGGQLLKKITKTVIMAHDGNDDNGDDGGCSRGGFDDIAVSGQNDIDGPLRSCISASSCHLPSPGSEGPLLVDACLFVCWLLNVPATC